jgi:copper chaperone CopZ
MKNIFNLFPKAIVITVFLMCSYQGNAQNTKTVKFHTSAQCGMCKSTIENALSYKPGIQFAELSMEDMFLTVKFKTKKTDEDAVKKMVSDIGYSAGDLKADEKAMRELPKCCQPGAHL